VQKAQLPQTKITLTNQFTDRTRNMLDYYIAIRLKTPAV